MTNLTLSVSHVHTYTNRAVVWCQSLIDAHFTALSLSLHTNPVALKAIAKAVKLCELIEGAIEDCEVKSFLTIIFINITHALTWTPPTSTTTTTTTLPHTHTGCTWRVLAHYPG